MLLLDRRLVHDFDCKGFLTVFVHAELDGSEGALPERLTEEITILNILELLEFLEVVHMQGLLALVAIDRAFLRGPLITRSIRIVCISTAVPSIHLLEIGRDGHVLGVLADAAAVVFGPAALQLLSIVA